tara:strand:+ start:531 stop:1157 length:627 start_codon:yes stop_codon:yes gene_type:complete
MQMVALLASKQFNYAFFIFCLLPLFYLFWRVNINASLEGIVFSNPQEYINRQLGIWGLRFIFLSFSISTLQSFLKLKTLVPIRKTIGLFGFMYIVLHLGSYIWLDQYFNFQAIFQDIANRAYITIGLIAFILLIPMTATSFKAIATCLNKKHWRQIHSLIYIIIPLGCIHFFMMRRGDQVEPIIYTGLGLGLIVIRIIQKFRHVDWRA